MTRRRIEPPVTLSRRGISQPGQGLVGREHAGAGSRGKQRVSSASERPGSAPVSFKGPCTYGGFAGICFPREYGGLGLGYEYKKAFDAESPAYETPLLLNVPSFAICCATILDMGSDEQKRATSTPRCAATKCSSRCCPNRVGDRISRRHHPSRSPRRTLVHQRRQDMDHLGFRRRLRTVPGPDRLGSNKTRWTDDVPGAASPSGGNHQPIRQVNGSVEFCEEFFDDVDVGDDALSGRSGKGWDVASDSCTMNAARWATGRNTPAGRESLSPRCFDRSAGPG